jgi:hypothetical protein
MDGAVLSFEAVAVLIARKTPRGGSGLRTAYFWFRFTKLRRISAPRNSDRFSAIIRGAIALENDSDDESSIHVRQTVP